jgi:5-methyltetrahydrofolate--homocysteine methyltransferase
LIFDENNNEQASFNPKTAGSKIKRKDYLALSDFIAPQSSGKTDYMGAFCVTTGFGTDELAEEYEKANDDYNASW